jgi:hypothetical protein
LDISLRRIGTELEIKLCGKFPQSARSQVEAWLPSNQAVTQHWTGCRLKTNQTETFSVVAFALLGGQVTNPALLRRSVRQPGNQSLLRRSVRQPGNQSLTRLLALCGRFPQVPSVMLRRVALLRTEVPEEIKASIIRVTLA